MEAYRIKNVSFSYPLTDKKALDNINLLIPRGEFVTLCGRSGSGKSTLLRHLKTIHTPHGEHEGEVLFLQEPLNQVESRRQVAEIGFVFQSPENQIVTDKVWHELAFGLESLGYDQSTIRLRVAEMASYFGIHTWFHQKVTELSGGQKQILNLAAIMTMQPSVLILDEPTSQLDPIAAYSFLETLRKINQELGITIIMSEHRLEDVIPFSDRLVVIDGGQIVADGHPRVVGTQLNDMDHPMFTAMPSAMKIAKGVEKEASSPLTINEARRWLDSFMENKEMKRTSLVTKNRVPSAHTIIKLTDVWFRYEKKAKDVIKDLSLEINEGEFCCIVGGNGTGKSTALSLISGTNIPYRGQALLNGKEIHRIPIKERFTNNLAILPQNPKSIFIKKTVELDLYEMLSDTKLNTEEKKMKIERVVEMTELSNHLSMHPYDLSGGEQQRAALAKVLLLEPKILLLDEPTKGLDAFYKQRFAKILFKLKEQGATILMVSHDIEFCAKYADICALFFDGSIVTKKEKRSFFAGNSFYTTAANRIARHHWPDVVTTEDVIYLCQQNS